MRSGLLRAAVLFPAILSLYACSPRDAQTKGLVQSAQGAESVVEAKGPDPRAAFESSGLLGGVTALLESPITLVSPAGSPEAGVCLTLGGALSTAVIARESVRGQNAAPREHELILASGAGLALPGPALALVESGDRVVVSCVESGGASGGSLLGFKIEGEGERLARSWIKKGAAVRRLLAIPGGRIAASEDAFGASGLATRLYLVDSTTGAEAWSAALSSAPADIAYSPGLILAALGSKLEAFDESTGASLWSAALTARAASLSAGNGIALVVAETGSLSAFSLADGKGIGAAPGPFDPALRPVADGSKAIVGSPGGGAAEVEIKSGTMTRSWSWSGPASFIAADRDRLYAGINGRAGRGLYIAPRLGDAKSEYLALPAPAFDFPVAVAGSRGGLLILLMDGSLVLVGKGREPAASASELDAALAPPEKTAEALSSDLGRFKPRSGTDPRPYLRFDLFVQGRPVDTDASFTAFRYDAGMSSKRFFRASPASTGAIVAIYDDTGNELDSSIDELGSTSTASAYLRKGKTYWIVAGWSYQSEVLQFRLFAK
jgi:hypothetical protein